MGCSKRPKGPNPVDEEIKKRRDAEAAAEQARKDIKAAEERIAELSNLNEKQQEKTKAAEQATEEAKAASQAWDRKEREAMADAKRASDEACSRAEAAAHTASEESRKLAAQAAEELRRTVAIQEQARRDAQAAQEQVKKLQEAADEEKRKATAAQEAANASKKAADAANAAKEEAERKLKEGIQPVVTPTPEEVRAAKQRVQYREDLFHIAIAGVAGGGKSSLINAFRGLRNKDIGAAATGVTETTLVMARYPHPNAEYPLVLYDFPGAGTLKIPDWLYFNDQGLYVFDSIIVLFDNRFTMTDIAILTNCRRFKIPTYIVRSKADQHIRNIMEDMGYDSDDDSSKVKKLHQAARQQFIQQTRQSVKDNLRDANIPDQRVYIVSYKTMLDVALNTTIFDVLARKQPKTIDEIELLNDLIREAQIRRGHRD
ncbi:interferon-inducible GTPase-domain-containing protein [Suillus discolor]|uniref:Interferon-inducible GTPase-domain-containing protein n=1 Tax=Suillus discolor TaxID=1912936 RepID=A0A9P7F3J0_9AGAM|nr:interferon-inducible GTPase-domain-containing protein [Suillus discolor]KAG2105087.1 interferon-inducible GTPase-domain-containing protein [Suillus discolor]